MYTFLLVVHILVAVLLIAVILIQRGRGGGLVESFSGVESMFGTKTSAMLTRATSIFAVLFLCTSISLAFLAAQRSRSLIKEPQAPFSAQKAAEEDKQLDESGLTQASGEQPAQPEVSVIPIEQSQEPEQGQAAEEGNIQD